MSYTVYDNNGRKIVYDLPTTKKQKREAITNSEKYELHNDEENKINKENEEKVNERYNYFVQKTKGTNPYGDYEPDYSGFTIDEIKEFNKIYSNRNYGLGGTARRNRSTARIRKANAHRRSARRNRSTVSARRSTARRSRSTARRSRSTARRSRR